MAATIARAMADYRAEVGRRLRGFREAKDLSQEDAAHELGVTTKTLSRWENGRRWPTPDHWTRIKDFYEADPREGVESPGPLGLGENSNQPPDLAGTVAANTDKLKALDERLGRIEGQLGQLLGAAGVDGEAQADLADRIVRTVERAISQRASEVARPPSRPAVAPGQSRRPPQAAA